MSNYRRITTVSITHEVDVVACRQSAKQIAAWLGLSTLEQIRLATSVSELARNVYQYVGSGTFHFDLRKDPHGLVNAIGFEAVDEGSGIADIERILDGSYVSPTGMGVGLRGAQRLMDEFDIQTSAAGTRIRALKSVYPPRPFPSEKRIQEIRRQLQTEGASDPYVELQVRGSELLLTSSELRSKQQELEATNLELENTNKGVVALYSELEKASQELQEASESKSRFFSNMTHEFRTPINIIENISKLLLKGADGELNPEQYKQVRFISSAASELSDLVNELLDLAEAESGRMEIVPARFSLVEFMEQLRQFTGALSMRYPTLDWQVTPILVDVILDTDRNRLFQIMRNLISNAFKYTPQGAISVRCFLPDSDTVEFMVEDSGVGIGAEDQARIFEEFARVRIPGLAHVQGNGLGLPLAVRLASLLRGDIELTSEVGKGSRFTARIAREFVEREADLQNLDLTGITVLIIDDNEADRYLVRHLLEPYHAVVIESENASASIDKMHAVRPDIILLDLDLPDIYGADLLESMDWSLHSRVLVNTAKLLDDTERDRLLSQSQGVLIKTQPDYAEALLQQVQRLAGSYRP
ncbi:ATP-binding protein [Pseudomonas sp. HR96]|uniref:ATP-binding protein n=1 Tax=Pseudomonas sp. HR96 TaxID=1027966 RepID=UPI002A749619|nr:ATP-binding protein [Pseudomonas sp. HR96]WPO98011.1 ATP-binding protein [Pseudomonas sp. HR96]